MTPTPTPLHGAPELLPCPFCNQSHTLKVVAASELFADEDEEVPYMHSESYAVICDASGPGGPGGCGGQGGFKPTEAEAIAAWNRRAIQQAAGAVPEGVSDEKLHHIWMNKAGAEVSWKTMCAIRDALAASPTSPVQPDSGHLGAGGSQDHLAACASDRVQVCRADGRCQYAIDHGAEGMGHCPPGKCAMPAITEWQPIETAPKDRTTVLLSVRTTYGKWNRTLPLAGRWFDGHWGIFNADEAVQKIYPTHWMPLPPPPRPDATPGQINPGSATREDGHGS